jgi:hypothetical protein
MYQYICSSYLQFGREVNRVEYCVLEEGQMVKSKVVGMCSYCLLSWLQCLPLMLQVMLEAPAA